MKLALSIINSPLLFVNFLIRVQEARTYTFYTIFLFSVFTGFVRALEELLFFKISLRNSEMLTFIHFYLSLGFILTCLLSKVGGLNWRKVNNVVVIGIFLGIFPPLIDKIFNPASGIFYGFYFLTDLRGVPWLGYKPEFNYPLGECITIWMSVFFSGYYIFYKTRSLLRSLAATALAYTGFLVYGSFLPMFVTWIVAGPIETIQQARELSESTLRSVLYYNALGQMVLTTVFYLLMRPGILRMLALRSLHPLPFVVVLLIGSAMAGGLNARSWLAAGMFFWGGWLTLAQNNFFDLEDDRSVNRENLEREDILFFNFTFLLALAMLFVLGLKITGPITISYALTYLYNYPFYRGKKSFPANLKMEGMWGLCAFLTGVLVFSEKQADNSLLVTALLVFGGWSLVAALKDAKDVRKDRRAGVKTLYLFLRGKGVKFRNAHRLIFSACFISFFVAPVYFLVTGAYAAAAALGLVAGAGFFILTFYAPSKNWFNGVLLTISSYLVCLLLLIVFGKASL